MADDEILGAVEVFQVGRDGIAEVAFAVRAHWRRVGVATRLFEAAKRWAKGTGIRILRMFVSQNNWLLRGLAEKVGGLLTFDLNEICVDVVVAAPPPTGAAFWRN